jgi:hypothetical protein
MMRAAIRECLSDCFSRNKHGLAYDLRPCDRNGSEIEIAPDDDRGLSEDESAEMQKDVEESDVNCYFYLSWAVEAGS